MSKQTIIKFDDVSFGYHESAPILEETNCSIHRGEKLALMGQNGAGKTTLFKLLTGELMQDDGRIIRHAKPSIAIARQVIPRNQLTLSVREYFQSMFGEKIYDLDPRIERTLDVVHLELDDYDRALSTFSGGQQARLLLASALIQEPQVLLLDEPTNNLDTEGIEHLTDFLRGYRNTVIVISHDAEFLNAFVDGIIYLDVFTKKLDQYVGTYYDALDQIGLQVDKERRQNARLEKNIQAKKDKANKFANKGGRLRMVAKQMRESAAEAEENKVAMKRDDKTIRSFTIPHQDKMKGELISITSIPYYWKGKQKSQKAKVSLYKGDRIRLTGPNGIGKTTLLEALANGTAEGAHFIDGVRMGYYRQDFSTLNFEHTVFESLAEVMDVVNEQELRSVAAGFLLTSAIMETPIHAISEGQKGLVSFARLMLEKPGILVLDEPTNHINFRHLPVIARALDEYQGAMIIVSHDEEFIEDIHVSEVVKIGK